MWEQVEVEKYRNGRRRCLKVTKSGAVIYTMIGSRSTRQHSVRRSRGEHGR